MIIIHLCDKGISLLRLGSISTDSSGSRFHGASIMLRFGESLKTQRLSQRVDATFRIFEPNFQRVDHVLR